MRAAREQLDIFGQINVWILACWTFCSLPPGSFLVENRNEWLYYSAARKDNHTIVYTKRLRWLLPHVRYSFKRSRAKLSRGMVWTEKQMKGCGGKEALNKQVESSWAARHEMLKQQRSCQGNFTPQQFHTSATNPLQLWTLCLLCVFIYFVSMSKMWEAKQWETRPKCRRVSGVWSKRRVSSEEKSHCAWMHFAILWDLKGLHVTLWKKNAFIPAYTPQQRTRLNPLAAEEYTLMNVNLENVLYVSIYKSQ